MTIAEMIPAVTPEELLRIPGNSTMELVNGRIVVKNGSVQSTAVEQTFVSLFRQFSTGHPIACVFPGNCGYRCFENWQDIRKPDVTVVLLNRLQGLSEAQADFMLVPPDLAIEVVAPADRVYDLDDRIAEYLNAGFPLVWVASPKMRTIKVFSRSARPMIYAADDDLTAEPTLSGFRCKVVDFFPPQSSEKKAPSQLQ